ncbi:LysR family transcriptional regulator [Enterobacter hormaechei subsp. xiangfangensis]|uniref:LysR family transcriptional regulator n=1 Tax=Enterobacter cloacae complex TaxID=354276 RepID=UPI000736F090|nr:LysR family transcriptional regulator [Enterobacter hormaechei]HDS9608037.1 LysR family transcriptional regulator [Enterobacter hormaechei subsp. steigerwaltii]KTQ53712.1 LysR family transcriptional regulator [Enterobacter hormaechei]KTQ56820.1 LysR family transcriptional regulator [Enterobacter hormaechei]KTQ64841.1 LysR family transcriptional regulator [Enterobacter hormaechei subsp. xiangfangensis]KTQ69512.1 LysR family transcriptional regulator [Enterobacter hormaechei subsp. xiangfange
MNYSLRQLRVFVTVAQARSFSRAGEIIGLSQSAVSHSVKELETQTGVKLLDRTTREVVLTEAGQQLAMRLERLLDELHSTLRDVGRLGQQLSGTVRVAASQTISAHLIPQCIAESNHRYPDIDFVLHDRPQQWVLESIRQGDVDFGIVIDPGAVSDLECEVVLSEPFLLLCRDDDPLASLPHVAWQALQGANLVLQDYASGSRPLIDAALAAQGVKATIVQEIGHPATLFPMVEAGIGISVLPALALPMPQGSRLTVKRFVPCFERQLMLVRRKNRSLSGAAHACWDVVRMQAERLMEARTRDPLFNETNNQM